MNIVSRHFEKLQTKGSVLETALEIPLKPKLAIRYRLQNGTILPKGHRD